jgi:hypothetical protein
VGTVSNLISDITLKFSDMAQGDLFGNLSNNFSSWEVVVAGFFIFAIFFYGLSIGRGRLLLFLISIYIAKLLVDSFVYVDLLDDVFKGRLFSAYLGLFIVSYVIVFIILDRSILRTRLSTKEFPVGKLLILSIMIVVLLANVVFTYLPSNVALSVDSGAINFIIGDTAFFWWFVASLFSILLLKRKKKRD